MAVTNGWGQATQNNTNGFGKYQNTIDAGSIYADSYAGETAIEGTSATFSYSKSSFHQGEADPTPTITGTAGGTFSATPSGLSINTSTGTIDLDNSTIQSYTITYTVSGVSANQTLAVTASPFIANNFSMQFDGASSYINAGDSDAFSFGNGSTDSPFSISTWVYFDNVSSTAGIISKKGSIGEEWQMYTHSSTSNIRFLIKDDSVNKSCFVTGNTTLATGQWYHIVSTYNGVGGSSAGNGIKIYLNGVEETLTVSNNASYVAMENTAQPVNIGRYDSNYFDGKLDEAALWNTALSSDAVTEIYNATANNTGKALDLSTDYNNYTSSANLQYWNRLGD